MAFIAAHLADSRFYLLKALGAERENPLARYFAASRSIDDLKELPPMAETLSAWSDASHALRDRLEAGLRERIAMDYFLVMEDLPRDQTVEHEFTAPEDVEEMVAQRVREGFKRKLESFGELQEKATGLTRQALTEIGAKMGELERATEEAAGGLRRSIAVHAEAELHKRGADAPPEAAPPSGETAPARGTVRAPFKRLG